MPERFEASWESLSGYSIPDWYRDGKFGIFLHWGVYSVPAFGNEWYPRNMYRPGTPEFEHHVNTYGTQERFGYKDFIPGLTFANYDPAAYARLFSEAGARFVVPVAEHHDGFAMYDSVLSDWCASKMGPKRDVLGELAEATRAEGMVFGLSSHRAEHWWFFDGGRTFPSDVTDPAFDGLYGPAEPAAADWHDMTAGSPDEAFLEDWLARTCEAVDRYRPQLVWFDWWIGNHAFEPYLRRFAAHYYNRGLEWGMGVAINYKYEAFPEGTAVFDVERGQLAGIRPELWQNDTSISKNSWGYIEGQEYKTATSLIGDLVDVVSKNGALLLNIGPKADGTIHDEEQRILREIGAWLKVNGEAIYGTRPWHTFGEGPTEVGEGAFTDTNRSSFVAGDIRFTTKGDILYAIAFSPESEILVASLAGANVSSVSLVGADVPIPFRMTPSGLAVTLLPGLSREPAVVLRLSLTL
ncbi:alpha-L-fucosidase [Fimbriimonas ginsengisoli]|uniref:alpha-L-fucosidase n=1 Tax=Fimbriimonas ginsengisoli Gsoil 348 TaxID=661478 RepID=A0A068NPX3_FIMGI|nr:alpha-L-fucosidase [Fimbriimonas ginsengisoli]AIE85427.1 alpha-L-fucosidase [Fimbriimonas ginsengisoli Gsoil 348]